MIRFICDGVRFHFVKMFNAHLSAMLEAFSVVCENVLFLLFILFGALVVCFMGCLGFPGFDVFLI